MNQTIDLQDIIVTDQNYVDMDGALFLPLIASLVISMAIIPIMIRFAPSLGMIDKPDTRKVHATPIPRVGGIAIVIGALLPIFLLLPLDSSLIAYFIGALVLMCFGALDDRYELGHYVKFFGQFIAALTVVYYGDVFVVHLPFMGGELVHASISKPFTVIALVGMINAINHSDGLDGLAGGESLMSLACISWLAFVAGGMTVTTIGLATIGGVFGFLRFNNHPARVFMGDSGSQFLGFTLGYLAVVLTQEVNPALSPALPLLFLGLPIADIIAVFIQRIYHKMNWFRASRNHIHHRLLDLGFKHYESVIIVYTVQALLVLLAIEMRYESDGLIIGMYLGIVLSIFLLFYYVEKSGWRMHYLGRATVLDVLLKSVVRNGELRVLPVIIYSLALFLVAGSFVSTSIPYGYTKIAVILSMLLLTRLILGFRAWFIPLRLMIYVTIAFIIYLLHYYSPDYLSDADPVTYVFFGVLAMAIGFGMRFSNEGKFDLSPMDFLVLLSVLVMVLSTNAGLLDQQVVAMVLKGVLLFYGAELILKHMKSRWNVFTVSVLMSLLIVSVRGVLQGIL